MAQRRKWPPAIREQAERISRTERLGPVETHRRLLAETGTDVPVSTIVRWLDRMARKDATSDVPTVSTLTERALRLASSELGRLERQRRPSMEDLAKVAQILKTIDGLKASGRPKQRTLSDLSDGRDGPEGETVRLAA